MTSCWKKKHTHTHTTINHPLCNLFTPPYESLRQNHPAETFWSLDLSCCRYCLKTTYLLTWLTYLWYLLFSHSVLSHSLQPQKLQASLSFIIFQSSYPLSQWCHSNILSSVIPFSFCLQSFPVPGSFPVSQFFASGSQSIGASASTSVFPMNIQGWFPLGLAALISLQSKGLTSTH